MTELKTKTCGACQGSGVLPGDTVGAQLRRQRESAGVKPSEMSTALNISPSYLYDLERNRRRWTSELVESYQRELKGLSDGK